MKKDKKQKRTDDAIKRLGLKTKEPVCPHFGLCGGCALQMLSYEDQLKLKAVQVQELFDGTLKTKNSEAQAGEGGITETAASGTETGKACKTYDFSGIIPSPEQFGYRGKMEFTFGDETKGGPLALGLHRRKSFLSIVDIRDCRLAHNDFNVIRNAVKDYFVPYCERGEIDFYHPKTHRGYLRHLLVRRAAATGEILAALVTAEPAPKHAPQESAAAEAGFSPDGMADAEAKEKTGFSACFSEAFDEEGLMNGLKERLLSLESAGLLEGKIAGIIHVYNNSLSDAIKCDRLDILYGRSYITERLLGLSFNISLFSFFQSNSLAAERLYETAVKFAMRAAAKDGALRPAAKETREKESCAELPVIYDLYSGTGTIAQIMSRAAKKVIGIEIVEEAVLAAKENARLNGIENAEFICGDVTKVLCGHEGDALPAPDLIILDPPREGLHPKALGKILSYGVKNIVYISCKPGSLASELQSFEAAGYRLIEAVCVDMFPQTANVEAVALLSKK